MANFNDAFAPEGGINLDDLVGIFAGTIDPSTGEVAPRGSLFLRDTGQLYLKVGSADTAWTQLSTGGSGGVAITSTDTTADFLNLKLLVSTSLQKTIQNAGANETLTLDLANIGTAGTYTSVTTNSKGQVIAGTNPGFLTANQPITLSGAVTGSGSTSIVTTLSNTGVTAGTYSYPTLTVNAQGRISAISSNTAVASLGITNGTGITLSVNASTGAVVLTSALDAGLQSLATLTGTGFVASTGTDTFVPRTLTAGSAKISITNGAGIAGNPTVDLGTVALDDLSNVEAPTPTVGQMLVWNGTAWVPFGGAGVGGGLRTWSGNIAAQVGTTQFAVSTSPPPITGGTELMTQTLTPTGTASKFSIQLALSVSASTNNNVHTAAIYRTVDGVSTYLGGAIQTFATGGNSNAIAVNITDAPNTTSPVTYSIRYGTNSGTWYVNRRVTENTYGGVQSGWEIQEY